MHQDLYGQAAFYGGNGAPDWACVTDKIRISAKPPLVWAAGYFWGKGVHRAFDHFWNNDAVYGKGLQDHFAEMWAMLAERYGGKPAFLGMISSTSPTPARRVAGCSAACY